MTLEQLRVLVKVVEAGSFTAAAEVLAMQRSNLSRTLAQLEAELGVTLLERTTRRQSVTEAGRAVYERALGVLAATEDMVRVTQSIQAQPQGHLRLTCGVEFGMATVGAWVEAFLLRHPQVSAEVEYASRELDLVHEGFDLAIRAGPLAESRLVARHLGQLEYGLYAAPAYLARAGALHQAPDLLEHDGVLFAGDGGAWRLLHPQQREAWQGCGRPRVKLNSGAGVCNAMLAGLGVGLLPEVVAEPLVAQGRLQQVLAPWRPLAAQIYAVYPSNRYLTPKVRAFVELARQRFPGAAPP